MSNNIIRRIKLIYKNAQRSKNQESFVEAEFRKLGFSYSGLFHLRAHLIKKLNELPSKTRRSLFRVFRAVAKRGEVINLLELFNIWKTSSKNLYKREQTKEYLDSISSVGHPYGDFRLLLTMEEIEKKKLEILNRLTFKIINGKIYFYVNNKVIFSSYLNYGAKEAIERTALGNWNWAIS